jgi:hypothetical protein
MINIITSTRRRKTFSAITSSPAGTLRNNSTAYYGFRFYVAQTVMITSIGRWGLTSNTKTHVVKRFEPNYVLPHIDSWIEAVLNSLMEKGNIYFLKYELVSDDKDENCGYHCLNFVQNEFVQLNQSAIINNGKYKRYDNTAWVL